MHNVRGDPLLEHPQFHLASDKFLVAFRDIARHGADLEVVVTDLANGRDLGCGAGKPTLLEAFHFLRHDSVRSR